MALSWWLGATNGTDEDSLRAVDDMAGVLAHMTAAYVDAGGAVPRKRKAGGDSTGKSKRRAT